DATMFANYQEGSIALRDLSDDDVAAICAAYPPTLPKSIDCDPTPRHGFSAECASEQPPPKEEPPPKQDGCAVAVPGHDAGPSGLALLGLSGGLGAVAARRRRGRARQGS